VEKPRSGSSAWSHAEKYAYFGNLQRCAGAGVSKWTRPESTIFEKGVCGNQFPQA